MAMMFFGLAFYLMALAKWGKSLKEKNATLGRRRAYGLLAAAPSFIGLAMYGWNVFMLAWAVICATLGYLTVAHAPRWIVGAPKPPEAGA